MWHWLKRKHSTSSHRPSGLVDTHSHILWELDDGARSMDQTIEMLKGYKQLGYSKVIATPHTNHASFDTPDPLVLESRILQIQDKARNLGIEIKAAGEIMLRGNYLDLFEEDAFPSIGNAYLVEFDVTPGALTHFDQLLFDVAKKERILVVAHPERYPDLQKKPELASHFREHGALMQINVMSLIGAYGQEPRKLARYLLQNNLVDMVGADYHNPSTIDLMNDALDELWDYDEATFRKLAIDNPTLLFEGRAREID